MTDLGKMIYEHFAKELQPGVRVAVCIDKKEMIEIQEVEKFIKSKTDLTVYILHLTRVQT